MSGINKALLKNLYIHRNLTCKEIAIELDYSKSKVFYWLRTYSIPRRPKAPRNKYILGIRILKKLYTLDRLSCPKIAEKLKVKSSETIRHRLIKYGIKRRNISEILTKYPKKSFSRNLNEHAYMLGLRTGDLSARVNHNMMRVYGASSHIAQLKMVNSIFGKYAHIGMYLSKHNGIMECNFYFDLDKTFKFLLKKPKKIPKIIVQNNANFFSFLAGYADCECDIGIRKSNRNNIRTFFRIRSSDKMILKMIKEKLTKLDYKLRFFLDARIGTETNLGKCNKDVWCLILERKNDVVQLFKTLLKFSKHEEKIKMMKFVLENLRINRWDKIQKKLLKLRNDIERDVLERSDVENGYRRINQLFG